MDRALHRRHAPSTSALTDTARPLPLIQYCFRTYGSEGGGWTGWTCDAYWRAWRRLEPSGRSPEAMTDVTQGVP